MAVACATAIGGFLVEVKKAQKNRASVLYSSPKILAAACRDHVVRAQLHARVHEDPRGAILLEEQVTARQNERDRHVAVRVGEQLRQENASSRAPRSLAAARSLVSSTWPIRVAS